MANIFDLFRQISGDSSSHEKKPIAFLIVGLGNPGEKYTTTRHNAGFLALDDIAERSHTTVNRSRFNALVGEAEIGESRVLLMKPQTFMNLSGNAVREAVNFYKLDSNHVIVISDDTSLDVGRMRVRQKGSAGGHNGLKSIIEQLGTDAFVRMRLGVGQKPHPDYDMADWVLGALSAEDLRAILTCYDRLYSGLVSIIKGDMDAAMRSCNGKGA